jgi:hypothetical protein
MSYNALNPPPLVRDKPANEVMRIAVHNGELHMSLRRGFNDPGAWGLLFVDAARHVARVYAHEKLFSEDEAIERIRAAFEQAIREPPEGSAEVTAIAKSE